MTQEEKAKAYDEVRDKIAIRFGSNVADEIFSGFEESEDERIRKEIISAIKEDWPGHEDWIAWLESQGETSPVLSNSSNIVKVEQKPAEIVKWSPQEENCICQLESLVKEQWRQAEKVHNSVNIKKMSELMFFLKTLNPNKKPQRIISAEAKEAMYDKPAWSEEDEYTLEGIIDEIQANKNTAANYEAKTYDRFLSFLKSLKDRVQPKQEWSEEDEEELKIALDTLEKAGQHSSATWLKNVCLVPQSTWKPSEEQMKILNEVLSFAANHESPYWNDYIFGTLSYLIRQLKKLREK